MRTPSQTNDGYKITIDEPNAGVWFVQVHGLMQKDPGQDVDTYEGAVVLAKSLAKDYGLWVHDRVANKVY